MRQKHNSQISIFEFFSENEVSQQLKAMGHFLDDNPSIIDLAAEDLQCSSTTQVGRQGLSVDSIVRAALIQRMMNLSYRQLSFLLTDSISFSSFTRLSQQTVSATTLQTNISKISAQTWEAMNRELLGVASNEGVEKGRMVRIDSTVTQTNIHQPTDSSLLNDCVRSMHSLLLKLEVHHKLGALRFHNHTRVSKRLAYNIGYSRGKNKLKLYRKLVRVTEQTKGYLEAALRAPATNQGMIYPAVVEQGEPLLALVEKVLNQTRMRVFDGKKVPVQDKIVSIFEPHTDIIVKGSRDVQYGHKLNLITGKSGLVLDVVVEDGNPADLTQLCPMLKRQEEIYGRMPRQMAADGGYASQDNLKAVKEMGVKDVAFNKKKGLKIEEMASSKWVYSKLRNFRAGVEGNISWLKRSFGLSRCLWKGLAKFKAYIWASSFAHNLLIMGRKQLAKAASG